MDASDPWAEPDGSPPSTADPWAEPHSGDPWAAPVPDGPASEWPSTVYLLHFDQPYKHARHYSGVTSDLAGRLAEHARGDGARLLQVVKAVGITWRLARTWPGGRDRERQLKIQGGASRRCPECGVRPRTDSSREAHTDVQARGPDRPPAPEEASIMTDRLSAHQLAADPATEPGTAMRIELPADLKAARQARAAVRQALTAWRMEQLAGDAELLVSELVANAAEHGNGQPVTLTLRCTAEPGGLTRITCEVTDTSPALPRRVDPVPDAERGRGLAILAGLAESSGVRAGLAGKTSWFTLALTDRIQRMAAAVTDWGTGGGAEL